MKYNWQFKKNDRWKAIDILLQVLCVFLLMKLRIDPCPLCFSSPLLEPPVAQQVLFETLGEEKRGINRTRANMNPFKIKEWCCWLLIPKAKAYKWHYYSTWWWEICFRVYKFPVREDELHGLTWLLAKEFSQDPRTIYLQRGYWWQGLVTNLQYFSFCPSCPSGDYQCSWNPDELPFHLSVSLSLFYRTLFPSTFTMYQALY